MNGNQRSRRFRAGYLTKLQTLKILARKTPPSEYLMVHPLVGLPEVPALNNGDSYS